MVKGKSYTSLESSLAPFDKATITSYIDDTTFSIGEKHTANLTVYYAGNKINKMIDIDVLEWKNLKTPIELKPSIEQPKENIIKTIISSPTIILTFCVIILVIINLVLFFRKKENKSDNKQ
jgi:hypothetical protein